MDDKYNTGRRSQLSHDDNQYHDQDEYQDQDQIEHDDQFDTQEHSSIGLLLDDDSDSNSDRSAFVKGYDRAEPQPTSTSIKRPRRSYTDMDGDSGPVPQATGRRPRIERNDSDVKNDGVRIADMDHRSPDDNGENSAADTGTRPQRVRRRSSEVEVSPFAPPQRERVRRRPENEENAYEAGIRDAQAFVGIQSNSTDGDEGMQSPAATRPPRRRPSQNPTPRPAVRANVPTTKKMPHAAGGRPGTNSDNTETLPEDAYDTFRKRYDPDELISSKRGGQERPPRKRAGAPTDEGVDLSASNGFDSPPRRRPRQPIAENDNVNLIRYAALGAILLFLGVIIILIASRSSLNRRYNELYVENERMRPIYEDASQVQARYNNLRGENQRQANHIAELENQLAANQPSTTSGAGGTSGGGTGGESIGSLAPELPAEHTIIAGDNLTNIAIRFYGNSTVVVNQNRAEFLAQYNNLNINNIPVGRTITIPVLPD